MIEQRREYYRVQYPVIERPVLTANTGRFEVIDVSEFGVRFEHDGLYSFEPGTPLVAKIRFNDGYEYECHGKVLRCDENSVGVHLHKPIPMKRIHAESVHLHQTYHVRYND